MKKNIFVYDDETQIGRRWKRQLEGLPSVHVSFAVDILDAEFTQAVADLEQRRRGARRKGGKAAVGDNIFDRAAVLIIDFDLFRNESSGYLTGEEVAYLARCYSRCGIIIGINQFGGDNPFDLTLKGHAESFADLNLGSRQIANGGLWDEPWSGFRPWSWPLIPDAVRALEARAKDLSENKSLDRPILKYLGFPEEVITTLPRSSREFLGSGDRPQDTTFRDFVLKSDNGLRPKDAAINDESISRIAAARISKWLERLILPGQDILVDAPHLVSRYPSLLKGDVAEFKSWNRTASFAGVTKIGIHYERIKEHRFARQNWLSRPAWFWNRVSNLEKISEVSDPWSIRKGNYVFCEDLSRFVSQKAAREFVAELPSPFVRRFVVDSKTRDGKKIAGDAEQVDYIPAVRFTL